jgi:glyoxylase-like metal-dependent hydrolase (beta-lactamase superfamily II)
MDQAADGVWLVTGTDVNWVLVADGADVTLVDTGEPRDLPRVRSSLDQIGRTLGDVTAVVLTHLIPTISALPNGCALSVASRSDC